MQWSRLGVNRWMPHISLWRCGFLPSTQDLSSRPQRSRGRQPQVLVAGVQSEVEGPAVLRIRKEHGLSLVELIVTVAILAILATVAYPIARFQIQRQKEQVLRDDLWEMRHAIDKYKDAADRKAFRTEIDSFGYPPDLDTLVKGVDVHDHKVKFLRSIPIDPMTGRADWVLRSMQDDPDSDSWGGQNVFDVHSASDGTALNGTKYSTW